MPGTPRPTRRDVVRLGLVAAAGASLAACTRGSDGSPAPTAPGGPKDPDRALRAEVGRQETALSALYAAAAAKLARRAGGVGHGARRTARGVPPGHRPGRPRDAAAERRRRRTAPRRAPSRSASPTPAVSLPSGAADIVAALRKAERAAATSRVAQSVRAVDAELARLIVLAGTGRRGRRRGAAWEACHERARQPRPRARRHRGRGLRLRRRRRARHRHAGDRGPARDGRAPRAARPAARPHHRAGRRARRRRAGVRAALPGRRRAIGPPPRRPRRGPPRRPVGRPRRRDQPRPPAAPPPSGPGVRRPQRHLVRSGAHLVRSSCSSRARVESIAAPTRWALRRSGAAARAKRGPGEERAGVTEPSLRRHPTHGSHDAGTAPPGPRSGGGADATERQRGSLEAQQAQPG